MSETRLSASSRILAFAAIAEAGTGLALIIDPAMVIDLLLGANASNAGPPLGRVAGIALLSLGVVCWPNRHRAGGDSPPFRAMLTYNLLIALFLAYLGTFGHLGGLLLWPAVVLHAAVALLLVWTRRDERRAGVTNR